MAWSWDYTWTILPQLLEGFTVTLQATIFGFAIAAVLGLAFALLRRSKVKWLSAPAAAFIEFIRCTPILVQLYIFFFILPLYGIRFPSLIVGTIALGLHYATYTSEVYRAGIDAVERVQWEASTALGFSSIDTWTRIILPQALPPMVPALGNYLVGMFKESSQLAAITVAELMLVAKSLGSHDFRFLEPITMAGAIYLLISYPSALLLSRLEARTSGHK